MIKTEQINDFVGRLDALRGYLWHTRQINRHSWRREAYAWSGFL